jgi:hypothetical protein
MIKQNKTQNITQNDDTIRQNDDGTITLTLSREDVIKIVISRAVFSAQNAGYAIDLEAVRLSSFGWGPGMSARVNLPLRAAALRAEAEIRAAGPRVEVDPKPGPSLAAGLGPRVDANETLAGRSAELPSES